QQLRAEMEKRGAYFMDDAQIAAMSKVIHRADGLPNPKAVGKSPQVLAQMAGITVPANVRVLVARLKGVGPEYPVLLEKLTGVFSENISVKHVLNVKRLAWGVREWTPDAATANAGMTSGGATSAALGTSDAQIEEIVRRVLADLRK